MKRRDLLGVGMSGIGLVLAMPPSPFGFLAAITLLGLFRFIEKSTLVSSFLGGYGVGLIWATGTLYWIGWATVPGALAVIVVFPIYLALFSAVMNRLFRLWGERAIWSAPFLFTGMEILMGGGVLGFPWNALAHAMAGYPRWIRFAAWGGEWGVTFWLVLINVLFFFTMKRWAEGRSIRRWAICLPVFVLMPWVYGFLDSPSNDPGENPLRVSLIQGNIDPYIRWSPAFVDSNFRIYGRLTRQAAGERPNLIVWPETAAPCYVRVDYRCRGFVQWLVDSLGIPLLTGAPDIDWIDQGESISYNAAFLFLPGEESLQGYHKRRLVPFSERVPFREHFPFLESFSKRFTLDIGNFSPGDSAVVFRVPHRQGEAPFSVLICYDSVFPQEARECVDAGARFLVIITNDGWFGHTSGPYQHAAIARFRAVENRVWVVRCANTGISEFIDPVGRIVDRTCLGETAILTADIGLTCGRTFFTRHGEAVRQSFLFFTIGILIAAILTVPLRHMKKRGSHLPMCKAKPRDSEEEGTAWRVLP